MFYKRLISKKKAWVGFLLALFLCFVFWSLWNNQENQSLDPVSYIFPSNQASNAHYIEATVVDKSLLITEFDPSLPIFQLSLQNIHSPDQPPILTMIGHKDWQIATYRKYPNRNPSSTNQYESSDRIYHSLKIDDKIRLHLDHQLDSQLLDSLTKTGSIPKDKLISYPIIVFIEIDP